MLTTACCLDLGIDAVPGWLLVMHTYLYCSTLSLSLSRFPYVCLTCVVAMTTYMLFRSVANAVCDSENVSSFVTAAGLPENANLRLSGKF